MSEREKGKTYGGENSKANNHREIAKAKGRIHICIVDKEGEGLQHHKQLKRIDHQMLIINTERRKEKYLVNMRVFPMT